MPKGRKIISTIDSKMAKCTRCDFLFEAKTASQLSMLRKLHFKTHHANIEVGNYDTVIGGIHTTGNKGNVPICTKITNFANLLNSSKNI